MVGKRKNLHHMLQSFMAMIIVTLLWVVVGFSLSFGSTIGGFIGDPTEYFMFQNVNINTLGNNSIHVICIVPS
jgi:Amt family ammonium transporter